MSREMLSQDEIDALLRQSIDSGESKDIELDQYLSPFDQDALGEIGNISFGSASTALSTLLGQKVEITTPKVKAIYRKDLINEFPLPHVSIHVEYTQGFKGANLFIIKEKDAKIIADLMLGGSGTTINAVELSEMDISAVQEAMNQMMGSAATSMSTIFNTIVNISPPGVEILDIPNGQGENNILEDEIVVLVSFKLKIGSLIDSNIMQLITLPFAKEMVNKLLGGSDEVVEEVRSPATTSDKEVAAAQAQIQSTKERHATPTASNEYYQNPYQQHHQNHRNNMNVNVQPVQFGDISSNERIRNQDPNLGLLLDIPLQITVELGRTKKLIKEILELSQGSIIELDKLAGEPVDIFANNKLIAKGEVVVIDENFGVRVTDIISQYDRVRKLQ